MARINKFEDLICWQKARVIVRDIYEIARKAGFKTDFSLRDQIRRAVNSVMLNIAEGFCRKTHKEFKQFFVFLSRLSWRGSICFVYCNGPEIYFK